MTAGPVGGVFWAQPSLLRPIYNRMVMAAVTSPTSIQLRAPQGESCNESFENFKFAETACHIRAALQKVAGRRAREYDLVMGDGRLKTEDKIASLNLARHAQVVGIRQKAGLERGRSRLVRTSGLYIYNS